MKLARAARSLLSLNRPLEVRTLLALMAVDQGHRMLDVGSGDGFWSARFASRAGMVVALDPSWELTGLARRYSARANLDFHVGQAEHLPYADEVFDRVVAVSTLEHFQDPARSLREVARTLRPGGVLALSVDSLTPENSTDSFRRWHAKKHFVTTYFRQDELLSLIHDSGLEPDAGAVKGIFCSRLAAEARGVFIRRPRLLLSLFPLFWILCRVSDRWGVGGSVPPQILIAKAVKPS